MCGQFVDINAAVAQDTGFAVDPADTGSSGYDAFKAFRRRGGGGHGVPRLLQVGPAARARKGHNTTCISTQDATVFYTGFFGSIPIEARRRELKVAAIFG